jgi:biotin carboxylase
MLRIWFNRAYATTWHVVEAVRANPDRRPVHVLGSHTDPASPVLAACDQVLAEPALAGPDYVEWALEVARIHEVEVLVPRQHMAELARARDRFAALGTHLLCPDADTVELFDDKASGYRAAADLDLPVPPHRVVRDSAGLRAAYAEFAALAEQVCMKPVRGVGGEGYRRLTTAPPDWDEDLAGEVRSLVRVDDVCRALDAAGPRDLLVMPFLDGAEVSVDVLADKAGTVCAAIGRRHGGEAGRERVLVDDPRAREIAESLTRAHRVSYLSNTQVRYWRGRPYLLELNTRAAGGLHQTALAGVNLPWAAIRLALGADPGPLRPRFGARYTEVSATVRLDRVGTRPSEAKADTTRPAPDDAKRGHR